MRLKSYFSGTVEAAIELARRELGEEALLVNARPATPETRALGAFEVVFGLPDGYHPPEAAAFVRESARAQASSGDPNGRLAQEVSELKRQLERMGQALRYPRVLPAAGSQQSALYARLIEAELEPALALQVAQGTPLEDLFSTDATLGRHATEPAHGFGKDGLGKDGFGKDGFGKDGVGKDGVGKDAPGKDAAAFSPPGKLSERALVALIGPPGAGKTTTLAKLAARYALAAHRPSQILSIDVCRIAAAWQLRTLAGILGIGCDVVETPAALAQAIEEHRHKDFVFIDTPGYASADMDEARELAAMFASEPSLDVHLVLAASMRPADLARAIDRYEMFSPHKLLFTRMDETESFGPLINESARRALPVSFFSTGQEIPDDLEPAGKKSLADRVRGSVPAASGAAA